ncbi:hypothetical protein LPJ66_007350, partial [Kickxella alabastrina]
DTADARDALERLQAERRTLLESIRGDKQRVDALERDHASIKRDMARASAVAASTHDVQALRRQVDKLASAAKAAKSESGGLFGSRGLSTSAVRKVVDEAIRAHEAEMRAMMAPSWLESDGDAAYANVARMIDSALSRFASDRLAKTDFALMSAGARIIPGLTSPTFEPRVRGLVRNLFRVFGSTSSLPPATVLDPSTHIGECWPMRGSSGQVAVHLAAPIDITEFALEHVPKAMAIDWRSAPRSVEVWGYVLQTNASGSSSASASAFGSAPASTPAFADSASSDQRLDNREPTPVTSAEAASHVIVNPPFATSGLGSGAALGKLTLLATYEYTPSDAEPVQIIPTLLQAEGRHSDGTIRARTVILKINSNWGHPDHTCIYRFRVHGFQPFLQGQLVIERDVFHVDQNGRQQGVVLSEMSDYEYDEASIRSLSLMQLLYPPESTYFWKHGGMPQVIETLTLADISKYHSEFYNYNNATLLLIGAYDKCPAAIFEALGKLDNDIMASPPLLRRPMPPIRTKIVRSRQDLVFASEKTQTGSMGFAWEGPPAEDLETVMALEMLFDYFEADPTSPLRKRFTNRAVPIAGDFKLVLEPYFPTMINLSFTNVPFASYTYHAAAAAAATPSKRGNSYAPTKYPSLADAFGPMDLSKLNDDIKGLYASNYYRNQLISTLKYVVTHWLSDHWADFHAFMAKRAAMLEASFAKNNMGDKHPQGILQMLSRDAIAFRFSSGSTDLAQPMFASRGKQFSMRKSLLDQKDHVFWQSLVQRWLLDGPMVHNAMIPDPKYYIHVEAERNLSQRNYIESKTPEELAAMHKRVDKAIASTKVCIPPEVLAAFPPTPDIAKVPIPKNFGHNYQLGNDREFAPSPFGIGRVVITPANEESSFQISLPLAGLASDLWPYLPLFTQLLTSSVDLVVPRLAIERISQSSCLPALKPSEMLQVYLNSEQVDRLMSHTLTKYNVFLGDRKHHKATDYWPFEVLTLCGSMPSANLLGAFNLLALKLLFGDFGVDAIFKAADKEHKRLTRKKGTSETLLIDTFQWIRIPGLLDARTIASASADNTSNVPNVDISRPPAEPLGRALNLYHQVAFLFSVTNALTAAMSGNRLATIRADHICDAILQLPPRKRPRANILSAALVKSTSLAYSIGNRQGSCNFVSLPSSLGIHVGLPNLQTSFVGVQVPLTVQEYPADTSIVSVKKQLESLPATDYYSLCLLIIILNRSEGLIKNAIRSRGHAYGVGIHPKCENGFLAVYISHAVDPQKSIEALWETIEMLTTEEGWNESITEFQLNSARSTFMFRCYNGFPQCVASEDAFALFCGFTGIEQYLVWVRKHIENISIADLRQSFLKCFKPIIVRDKSVSALYIVATPASFT